MTRPGWWDVRTPREKMLLLLAATLALAALLWLGLLRPAARYAERQRGVEAQATQALAEVRRLAGERSARPARPQPQEAVQLLVARRASEAGLTLASLEAPDGLRVTLAIDAVRPVVLFPWLDALAARDGVTVETMAVARNDDASLAVRATLTAGGA
jgi:type II secretory pathway component PulM